MKRLATILICSSALLFSEVGETSDPPLVKTGYGLSVAIPQGWVSTKPAKGSVLSFHSAQDKSRRIHVRVASGISKEQSKRFFAETHANLVGAGFERSDERERAYSGLSGRESIYGQAAGGQHRLVVWCLHKGDNAWIVTGYFSTTAYRTGYTAYQDLLKGLTVDPNSKSKKR